MKHIKEDIKKRGGGNHAFITCVITKIRKKITERNPKICLIKRINCL